MHPILSHRDRLSLYLAAWLPIAALLTAILARGTDLSLLDGLVIAVPMCLLYAFMCLAAWYICRTSPFSAGSLMTLVGTLSTVTLVVSVVWVLLGRSWTATLELIPMFAGLTGRYTSQIAVLFLSGVLLFLLAIAVHYLLLMLEESRAAEKHALELQVFAREAELRALRAQIDPHFLFNSLNSISALTVPDPSSARRMCLLLADFMRTSLSVGSRDQISFSEEIALTENFLNIEKVRFGERLSVEYRIDPSCRDCKVPPLLIQPLVENAITHGVAPLIDGGTVSIEGRLSGELLEIVLKNPYDTELAGKRGTGLGLRNVRERLKNMFADNAQVQISQSGGMFRVTLQLPCVRNGVHR